MDTAIIVAIITAIATVAAACIARSARGPSHTHPRPEPRPHVTAPPAQQQRATGSLVGHGSDSSWWKDWPPTPQVIAIRAEYKDRVWVETDVTRIRQLLYEYWSAEQGTWIAAGMKPWGAVAERAFMRDVARVKNPVMAIRVIENVQNNKY